MPPGLHTAMRVCSALWPVSRMRRDLGPGALVLAGVALSSLFSGGRTTALVNPIAGLDDFELIAFLVVMP